MTSGTQNFAPYAPTKNVLEVIRRKRDRGLPDIVNSQVLQQIGVPLGNVSRTLRALQFLGLIEESGRQTEALQRLGTASTEEYPALLADILRKAYHPVFTIVDPSRDKESAIADAFRQYEPHAQRERMVILFVKLSQEAGLAQRQPYKTAVSSVKRSRPQRAQAEGVANSATLANPPVPEDDSMMQFSTYPPAALVDYRVVSALMQQLPTDGKWTKNKREKWIQAVTAAVDLMVETVD